MKNELKTSDNNNDYDNNWGIYFMLLFSNITLLLVLGFSKIKGGMSEVWQITIAIITIIPTIITVTTTLMTRNKKISKTNTTKLETIDKEINAKIDTVDKDGHTYKKVNDSHVIINKNNQLLVKIYERQKTKDETIGQNFGTTIQSIVNLYEKTMINNQLMAKINTLEIENKVLQKRIMTLEKKSFEQENPELER